MHLLSVCYVPKPFKLEDKLVDKVKLSTWRLHFNWEWYDKEQNKHVNFFRILEMIRIVEQKVEERREAENASAQGQALPF